MMKVSAGMLCAFSCAASSGDKMNLNGMMMKEKMEERREK
jgi:hypothetical protein